MAAPCGLKDDAVHDEQVSDGVGERFLEVAGELAAGDVQHALADARDVPGVGVHGVEGVVGAEHAHPQERHAADRHILDRVQGLLVGITARCHVFGQDDPVDPRGHRPAFQRVIELVRLERVFVLVGEVDQRGIRGQRGPVNSESGRHQPTVVSSPAPARPVAGKGTSRRPTVAGMCSYRGCFASAFTARWECQRRLLESLAMGPDRGHQHRKAAASLVCAGVVTAQPGVQAC
ncbi:hypothetical protein BV881_24050 [Streptomyces sp. ZL-24]|nr:hypothetical protein BV881_24050 [Streptomyces sp. ZL-24]